MFCKADIKNANCRQAFSVRSQQELILTLLYLKRSAISCTLLSLLLVICSQLAGLSQPVKAGVQIESLQLLIDTGKYIDALQLLNSSGAMDNNEKLYYKGRALYGLGKLNEAELIFNEAISISPKDPRYYGALGVIAGQKGKMKQAILFFSKSLSVDKNYVSGYNNRGIAYAALGKQKDALKDFTEAIKLDPRHSDSYRNRGIIYQSMGNLLDACDDWAVAAALGQDDPKEWIALECKRK